MLTSLATTTDAHYTTVRAHAPTLAFAVYLVVSWRLDRLGKLRRTHSDLETGCCSLLENGKALTFWPRRLCQRFVKSRPPNRHARWFSLQEMRRRTRRKKLLAGDGAHDRLPNLKRDVWKGMTSSRRRPQEQADRRRRRKAWLTTSCPRRRKWLWVGGSSSTSGASTIPRRTASLCASLSTVEHLKVLKCSIDLSALR